MGKRRKSGDGTIRKRIDGRWEGRVVIGYDEKNLPITKNVTAKTKTECLEKLEKLKDELGTAVKKQCRQCHSANGWTFGIRLTVKIR